VEIETMVRVVEALSRQGGSVGTMFRQAVEIVKWRRAPATPCGDGVALYTCRTWLTCR